MGKPTTTELLRAVQREGREIRVLVAESLSAPLGALVVVAVLGFLLGVAVFGVLALATGLIPATPQPLEPFIFGRL